MAGAAWVAALLAAGCTKEGRPATGWEADPDAVRIEASVGTVTKTNPLGNDEEQTKFNSEDKIAVAAVDNGTVKKTVKYQFDGTSSWTPMADESGATDYLVWDTPVTFRAWYPAGRSSDGVEFSLPAIQDGTKEFTLANADIMSSDDCTYGDIPVDRTFKPELKRRMALVTIIIDKIEEEFDYIENPEFANVKIYSAHSSVKRQSDGTFASVEVPQGITPTKHKIDDKTAFSAIVTPGKYEKDYHFLSFYIGNDASGYKDLYVQGIPAAEARKHYIYKLIVGKQTVKIGGVTVENWTTGKLDGKFEAEVDNYSEWDGKKVTGNYYFSGEGSATSPYLIQSATDLAGLAAMVNSGTSYQGKYFKLQTNIDLMGHEWTPIGNSSSKFEGIFDGNSKIITNMSITAAPSSGYGVGLFGYCMDASISGVVLKNARIRIAGIVESLSSAGLICGMFSGTVKNCRVEGSIIINVKDSNGYDIACYCGGIIGEANAGTSVSDCEVEIYGENSFGARGGIVGYFMNDNAKLTIESCIVKGEINGENSGFGGIAGSLQGHNVLVKNCTSYARLGKATDVTAPKAGGLVGRFTYGKAENCTVYGSISFTSDSALIGGMFSDVYDVTLSNLNFSGDIDITIQGESSIKPNIGAFIAWLGGTSTTATGCTYKKSGTGNYPVVGEFGENNFDETKLDITGI